MKKNVIFIFLKKNQLKEGQKKIIALDTFFKKKNKSWIKVGQKNWIFIIHFSTITPFNLTILLGFFYRY
jgi:hypothetical protein